MKYDEVITAAGGCGRYQMFILNLVYIGTIYDGLQIGSMVFVVPNIKHRCAIPNLVNDTYEVQSEAHAKLIQKYIPEKIVDGETQYSQCNIYVNKSNQHGNQTLATCSSWVYDKSIFQSTMTSEFNLVCGDDWYVQQIYTVFFAGYLVAMVSMGWLSDRIGRKAVIIMSLMLQGTGGILSSQIKNIKMILVLRFLTAIGGAGSYIPACVYGTELSAIKNRTVASISGQMYYVIGYFIICLVAYFIRTWDWILLLASLPSIPTALILIWLIPESPRWLMTVNKKKEAVVIINKMAEINKQDFKCKEKEIEALVTEDRTVRLWKIFTIPKLLKITLIMLFNWICVSFVYYGLMLNTENFHGNIYLNFFLGSVVELPAFIICIVLLNVLGRKKMYIAFTLFGGICAILTTFPVMYASNDLLWTSTALAILSRLCISGCFGIIYLHTCELYPTCVRNGGLGIHSTISRIGGSLAPYVMMMRFLSHGKFGENLPVLTMGIVCIFAGISYFFLPETNNCPMDDTFDGVCNNNEDQSERKFEEYRLEQKTPLNI